jgi:hypothetical protein
VKKRKLPRVAAPPGDTSSIYSSGSIAYALVSSPKKGRQQIHSVCTCKDFLHDVVRAYLHPDSEEASTTYYKEDSPDVDMTALRLLLTRDRFEGESVDQFKKKIFSAKAVLNVYEKAYGWKPSKISTVVHPNFDHAWLLTGPPQWMRASYMVSLVSLILRLGGGKGPFPAFDNVKQVQAYWAKLCSNHTGGDVGLMSSVHTKLPVLFENFDDLFAKTPKELYPHTYKSGWFHSSGGIVNFCGFSTDMPEAKKFKKLCKEAGVA